MICKYLFSISVRPFKPPQLPYDVSTPLYLNLYKTDSQNIARHIHRLKVDKVQKGGCTYLFTDDKVGLAVGVKGSAFLSGATIARKTRSIGFGNIVLVHSELDAKLTAQVLSGIIQANYRFKRLGQATQQKEAEEEHAGRYASIQHIHVSEDIYENDYVQALIKLANYKLYARDLANMRQDGTPQRFVQEVQSLFKDNPKVQTHFIEGEELKNQGLNLFYAVGKAAQAAPCLINLVYRGKPESQDTIALIGKGITFDSGGLNLKSFGSMESMYLDKSGACNVLAAFRGAVEMGLKVNITATLGMAENAISGKSYKPSDILLSHAGLTVEVHNTDAEGRLVLADCLSWTQGKYNPVEIIEMSTLTGGCAAALGENTAGLMCNNESLAEKLMAVSNEIQEPLWRLPVTEEHREMLKSDFADINNVGSSKVCAAQKAAAFLFAFVKEVRLVVSQKTPFAHIDIAGPMESKADKNLNPPGATGFGSQVLLRYLMSKE